MLTILFPYADWGVLLLRVIFGLIFLIHGWPKLKNLKGTQAWFDSVGFKPGVFWGTLVALLEVFGGLLLIVGFLTQIISILLAIQMFVITIWKIKIGQKFVSGYELDLILLGVAIAFMLNGGATYALDAYYNSVLF